MTQGFAIDIGMTFFADCLLMLISWKGDARIVTIEGGIVSSTM
jgi:hypothetical protein